MAKLDFTNFLLLDLIAIISLNKGQQQGKPHSNTYINGETRWQVRYKINKGKRKSEIFDTKEKAETAAKQARLKVVAEGSAGFSLPRDVQVEAAAAITTLAPYEGETIAKAVEFYVAHSLRFRNAPTVSKVSKEFVAEREQLTNATAIFQTCANV